MAFNLKGAGQGAAQGASAGSAAGGWGAAIGAIGGALIGGFMGNKGSKESLSDQYAYNLSLQKQAQKWQEKMASTAYQRTKADLLESGYNPLTAVTNGTNTTPSASVASVSQDNRGQILANTFQNAISNAIQARQQQNQDKLIEAQVNNINQNTNATQIKSQLDRMEMITKAIENANLDKNIKAQIKRDIAIALKAEAEAKATPVNAESQKTIAEAQKQNAETNKNDATVNRIFQLSMLLGGGLLGFASLGGKAGIQALFKPKPKVGF